MDVLWLCSVPHLKVQPDNFCVYLQQVFFFLTTLRGTQMETCPPPSGASTAVHPMEAWLQARAETGVRERRGGAGGPGRG